MKAEKRTFNIEFRASEDTESRVIEGYAALFDERSQELWGFVEEIKSGAFDKADLSDVRALFNHDPNYILARSASKTLQLEVDEKGLKYRFEVPETTFGNDFLTMVRRGDINQSSFAFTITADEWHERDGEMPVRYITEINQVYDVSPVTYPAYEKTSVTARSFDQFKEDKQEEKKPKPDLRAMKLKLLKIKNY